MLLALLLAATPNITWHGGKVLVAPRYHNLYWGQFWADRPDHVAWFDAFTAAVSGSRELLSQVEEYSLPGQRIGPGSYAGGAVVRTSPAATITDAGLEDFIQAQIASGVVPAPSGEDVYAVFLPPGVKIQGEDEAVGYHTRSRYGFYEIMIHFDPYGSDSLDRSVAGIIYSHEMAESITDPGLDAWYDAATRDEIADVCQQHHTTAAGYTIQQEWSNAAGACSPGASPNSASTSATASVPATGCSSTDSTSLTLLGLCIAFASNAKRAKRAKESCGFGGECANGCSRACATDAGLRPRSNLARLARLAFDRKTQESVTASRGGRGGRLRATARSGRPKTRSSDRE